MKKYLQVAALGLLEFDRLEEGLEIARPKSKEVVTLDHLQEQSWTVLHILGENLQQVPIFVVVYEDFELLQYLHVLLDLEIARLQPLLQQIVVRVWDLVKLEY